MRAVTRLFGNFIRKSSGHDENYGGELNATKIGAGSEKQEASSEDVELTERALTLLAGHVATEHDMRDIINDMVDAKGSKTRVAFGLGISLPFLSDVMLGRRPVSGKLAANLGGWEKVVVFRRR